MQTMRLSRVSAPLALAASLLLSSVAAPASAACSSDAVTYDLPAQRLDISLQAFAHRSGCTVEVRSADLADIQAPAVSGQYTPDQALVELVKGSGFETHANSGHLAVNKKDQTILLDQAEALDKRRAALLKAEQLSKPQSQAVANQLARLRLQLPALIREQGFLSAAEKASYKRLLKRAEDQLDGKS